MQHRRSCGSLWMVVATVLMVFAASWLVQAATAREPIDRDDWVEPHAWTRRQSGPSGKRGPDNCPPCPQSVATDADGPAPPTSNACPPNDEQRFSDFAYRKLVNFLINSARMKRDPGSGQLHRKLNIEVSAEQYDRLRDPAADLREIDGLLQEVWHQSSQGTMEQMRETLSSWSDWWLLTWRRLLDTRWLVTGAQFAAIAAVYVLARRHRISVAALAAAGLAFAVYRYLDAECHRKLEIERIADLMHRNSEQHNPCDDGATATWTSYWFGGGDRRAECVRFLETRYERECDVKALYDGFMQQFVFGTMESFFAAILDVTAKVRGTYGWIGMLVVSVLIYANLGVIIASIFRYVIGPLVEAVWMGRRRAADTGVVQPQVIQVTPAAVADQLSGANIERILSITESQTRMVSAMADAFRTKLTISATSAEPIEKPAPAIEMTRAVGEPSGVQEVVVEEKSEQAADGAAATAPAAGDAEELLVPTGGLAPSSTCSSELGDTASEDDIVILEHFREDEHPTGQANS